MHPLAELVRRFCLALVALGFLSSLALGQNRGNSGNTPVMQKFDLLQLEQRLRSLGPGDRSVIEAAVSKPGSVMTTSPGSPNDLLWSEMEKAGWTKRVNPFEGSPNAKELAALLRSFALTEDGAKAAAVALARLKAN
jgi:hypothetical protein